MSRHRKQARRSRDAPRMQRRSAAVAICPDDSWRVLIADGYRPLTQCPEVMMCVNVYAELIASMTIHLMENGEHGDTRVKDELSRMVDITPNPLMTHQGFMETIVRTLMTEGNQVTLPVFASGLLMQLDPVPPSRVTFVPEGRGYRVNVGGASFAPDEVIHFALNPDPEYPWRGMGYEVALFDVVRSIRQTQATRQALMESPKPSIIVKVDGFSEDMQSPEGRARIANKYISDSENGRPWIIPAESMKIEQIKPLTLSDLAIDKSLELDKRSIAAMFGVPPFLVGVGEFKAEEFNWFVANRLMRVARVIEQTLTRALLLSPARYFRLNSRSLTNYDLDKCISAGREMVDRMAMDRNEWRDWVGLPPSPKMEEILGLENYIPANRLGDQKKLVGNEEGEQNEDQVADPKPSGDV